MLGEPLGLCCLAVALPVATPESQGVSSEAVLRWIGACEAAVGESVENGMIFRKVHYHE